MLVLSTASFLPADHTLGAHAKDTLRSAIPDDITTADPFSFHSTTGGRVFALAYEGFTAWDAGGRVVPALAVGWESPDDGLTWQMRLRPGVRLHTGGTLSAADVKRTIERYLGQHQATAEPTLILSRLVGASAFAVGQAREVAGIRVIDPHTIQFQFTSPEVLFPSYPIPIVDAADAGSLAWDGIPSAGTGPFRIVAWNRGASVALVRHAAYWGDDNPGVDALQFSILPAAETFLSSFDAGALDAALLPDDAIRTVMTDPRYAEVRLVAERPQVRYLGLNQDLYPPFRDRRVREAVAAALDRPAMAQAFYGGAATVIQGTVPPGLGDYWPEDGLAVPFDPDRARRLLADAGFAGGTGLPPVNLACDAQSRDLMTYTADRLRAVGFPAFVQVMERAALITAQNGGRLGFFLSGWTADHPDPLNFLMPMWTSTSPFNRSKWKHPEFDRLIASARTIVDEKRRHALYRQAERLLAEERAMVPMPTPKYVALVRRGVTGVALSPLGSLILRNVVVP